MTSRHTRQSALHTMRFIVKFIKEILTKEKPAPLGRWKLEYCDVKVKNKTELSNEDHCGPCGQYALTRRSDKKLT